jgi:hypothetical protein
MCDCSTHKKIGDRGEVYSGHCRYWCACCDGDGKIRSPWPNENDWACGVCYSCGLGEGHRGHNQDVCTCGKCDAFGPPLDIEFIREIHRLNAEGKL